MSTHSDTPRVLTKKRIEALLEMAGRGEDDLYYYWHDNWGIDIGRDDDDIREQIAVSDPDELPDLSEVWESVHTYRTSKAARQIMGRRYLT